jgi:hypothetical protein
MKAEQDRWRGVGVHRRIAVVRVQLKLGLLQSGSGVHLQKNLQRLK